MEFGKGRLALKCGALLVFAALGVVWGAPFSIHSQSNIFHSGMGMALQPIGGAEGLYPASVSIPGHAGLLYFQVQSWSGLWSYMPDYPPAQSVGAEGHVEEAGPDKGTDLTGENNISGIKHANKLMFVTGLFLGANTPLVAPDRYSLTEDTDDFSWLSPQLGQIFFIGDGRTAGGELQNFIVPTGAMALYLGVADGVNFHGAPGSYGDNTGMIDVEYVFREVDQVPEPATLTLVGAGLLGAYLIHRRRRT